MKVIPEGGPEIVIGTTETGATIGIIDFSRRSTDDFGVTTVVERGFARRMSARVVLPFEDVDGVQQQLAALRATPVQWVADDRFDWLNFEGFYKDFELDLAMPPVSYCTLTVEGLAETETVVDAGEDPAPTGSTSTLRLIAPVTITSAMLTSSSVAENDYPEWSALTTYAQGDRVIKAATHRVYESAGGGNLANDPEAEDGQWIEIGSTNRWAMFDQALGSATSGTSPLVVTLAPGAVDALAMLDVTGDTIRVQATGYDETIPVGADAATFLDLPGTGEPITVTVTGTGTVGVGTLLVGALVTLGVIEASATAGINDFSRKETDEFGEVTVVERAWSKRMTARATIRTDAVDVVANRIAAVRAVPSLWIGEQGLDSLTVYGFFKDFSIEVGETVSRLSLAIEGLAKAPPPAPLPSVDWVNVVDSDPVAHPKPEDGATVGGTIGENVTNGEGAVVDPGELLNSAMDLVGDGRSLKLQYTPEGGGPVTLAEVTAPDLGAARQAVAAQAEDALERLAAAMVQLQALAAETRAIVRDAGISVDPATGRVHLHAFDRSEERLNTVDIRMNAAEANILLRATTTYVDNAIAVAVIDPSEVPVFTALETRITDAEAEIDGLNAAVTLRATIVDVNAIEARVTTAESDIDALAAIITTKVSTSTFDALETRVDSAESTLSAIDGASITATVRAARLLADDAEDQAANTLAALIAGDRAKRAQVAAIAEARQELTAKIIDDVAAEASQRLTLAARIAAAEATIVSESTARATEDGALAATIDLVATEVDGHTASIDSVSASLNGVLAKAAVRLDVAGRITGWEANNDGDEGDFTILADKFAIVDPDGGPGTTFANGAWKVIDESAALRVQLGNLDA